MRCEKREKALTIATYVATYRDGERKGLQGALTDLIGGIAQVVTAVADELEFPEEAAS